MMKQRQRHRSPLLTALLALMMLVETGVAVAGLTVMHGYVDYASALIWIQTDAPGPVEVAWRIEGDEQMRRATFDARALDDNIVVARLTGLLPGSLVCDCRRRRTPRRHTARAAAMDASRRRTRHFDCDRLVLFPRRRESDLGLAELWQRL